MANAEQLLALRRGKWAWAEWRTAHPDATLDFAYSDLRHASLNGLDLDQADFREADLSGASLERTSLRGANLARADLKQAFALHVDLTRANLHRADLKEAFLVEATLSHANLALADLSKARLHGSVLVQANLVKTILVEADLLGANLAMARLIETNLERADLTDCIVYGISTWDVRLEGATQTNLTITNIENHDQPLISVDSIEVAQFVHLLLNNVKLRDVIDVLATKTVLVLGRFTPLRKPILDAIRDAIRRRGYVPLLFDFAKPTSRDMTETVSTLAHLSRFIIVDLTDARSVPQELERIVPNLPSVPVQPVLASSDREYAMFEHFRRYPWVLVPHRYRDLDHLLATLDKNVIAPAEAARLTTIPREWRSSK